MSMTLTPDPTNRRVVVEFSSGAGNYTQLQVRRDGAVLPEQPYLGSAVSSVSDFQAPRGVTVTYTATWTTASSSGTETGSTVLDVPTLGLIHPRQPSLSMEVTRGESALMLVALGDRDRAANSTLFPVHGSSLGVVVTTGNRGSDTRSVVLASSTRQASAALDALLQDETPILFRMPESFDVDFTDGFYRVGDFSKHPYVDGAGMWWLQWTLPIQQVRQPRVIVQPSWTEADLIAAYATEQDVIDAFATEYDLILNRTR